MAIGAAAGVEALLLEVQYVNDGPAAREDASGVRMQVTPTAPPPAKAVRLVTVEGTSGPQQARAAAAARGCCAPLNHPSPPPPMPLNPM